jgi:hypothetical protein
MNTQMIFRTFHDALPFQGCDDILRLSIDPDLGSEIPALDGSGAVNLGYQRIAECRTCLRFEFDLEEATERLALEPHQLKWALVAKDPQLRRLAVMEEARFETNGGTITTLLDPYGSRDLLGARGLRLELLITLAESLPSVSGRPQAKGTVIARSVVEFRCAAKEVPFPINYSGTAWFMNRGLPKGTLWWLELVEGATPETDPAAAIRVTLTEDLRTVMNGLERGNPIARSYADYVASDILVELVRVVMELQGDTPFPENPHGLLGHLAKAFGRPAQDPMEVLEDIRRWHRQEPGRIRAEAQQLVAATDEWRAIRRRESAA